MSRIIHRGRVMAIEYTPSAVTVIDVVLCDEPDGALIVAANHRDCGREASRYRVYWDAGADRFVLVCLAGTTAEVTELSNHIHEALDLFRWEIVEEWTELCTPPTPQQSQHFCEQDER